MYAFDYSKPKSLDEAVKALGALEEPKLLAGGHTLLPAMKLRLNAPKHLIDLGGLGLTGVERKGDAIVIKAMTTHADVTSSAALQQAIPGLAALVSYIGDPHVRHRGTIGGSIANNDPAADYPAACLALGATITTNTRSILADDFFKGMFDTALGDGEIITQVSFPIPKAMGYAKFANPASRFALVGVAVAQTANGARVAVTGAGGNGVFRWKEAEAKLAAFDPKSLDGLKHSATNINSDIHADADYRAHLIGVMTKRAVAKALGTRI
ncbi:MAG: FAD binding domain-containing protein [Beijerinckiaceae bacterium]